MNLKDVIDTTLLYLNKPLVDGEFQVETEEIEKLIKCANVIYQEIANGYIFLNHTETLKPEDCKISYSRLEKRIIDVVSVKACGRAVQWKHYPTYIKLKSNEAVEVEYYYKPEKIGLEDEVLYCTRLDKSTFAYGVASNYCMINGMYEEAVTFDTKFRERLGQTISEHRKPFYVKCRKWL